MSAPADRLREAAAKVRTGDVVAEALREPLAEMLYEAAGWYQWTPAFARPVSVSGALAVADVILGGAS